MQGSLSALRHGQPKFISKLEVWSRLPDKIYLYILRVLNYFSFAFSFTQPIIISLYGLCSLILNICYLYNFVETVLFFLRVILMYNFCGRLTGILLPLRRKFRMSYYLFSKD